MLGKIGCSKLIQGWIYGPRKALTALSGQIFRPFSSQKGRFQVSREMKDIIEALQISSINDLRPKNGESSSVKPEDLLKAELQAKIKSEFDLLILDFEQISEFLHSNLGKHNKQLAVINLTVEEIDEEYKNIHEKLEQMIEKHRGKAIEGMIELIVSIRKFISKPVVLAIGGITLQDEFFRMIFYLEVAIKVRDLLHSFEGIEDSLFDKSDQSKIWDKLCLVKMPDPLKTAEEYQNLDLILRCVGGACMSTPVNENSLRQQMKLVYEMVKTPLQLKKQLLKNLQMHYRLSFDKIIHQLNLIDYGIFKTMFQATCPKIKTNILIYVPLDPKDDENCDIFKQESTSIPVRILHHEDLPTAGDNAAAEIEDIVIHMHGGGYVVLSSSGTQSYTRIWANQTKVPVFSIDYRLAPKHPYPTAAHDCLRVYQFILKNIHKYYKINPKNIFLGGDSAGGNLSCALTTLVLKNNLHPPKGLHLVYPSLDSRMSFYGSRKQMLWQPLLWPSLARLAVQSYYTKQTDNVEPLASPIFLTESYLSGKEGDARFPVNWPRTYIEVGIKDTLRDESLIFMQKMAESNVDCKCYLMSDHKHGYLCIEAALPSSAGIVFHSSQILKELISKAKGQN